MENLEEVGLFWIPEGPEPQAGELTFDPTTGTQVSLVGEATWARDWPDSPDLIVGVAGKSDVTLIKPYKSKHRMFSSGVENQSFYANELLIGHSFEKLDDVIFTSAVARLHGLSDWMQQRGLTEETKWATSDTGDVIHLRYERPKALSGTFRGGEVSIQFGWSKKRSSEDWKLEFWPSVRFEYGEPVRHELILRHIANLQSLFTLCTDVATTSTQVVFYRKDLLVQMLDGSTKDIEQPIEYRAQPITTPLFVEKHNAQRNYYLSFETIGGIDTVTRWIDIASDYKPVVNLLATMRAEKAMYAENRFLNVVNAAEAFHRLRHSGTQIPKDDFDELCELIKSATPDQHREWISGKLQYLNEPTLRKRLKHLGNETKIITGDITGKISDWALTISGVRNKLTHYNRSESGKFPGGVLYWLGESVYQVVRMNLLSECVDNLTALQSSLQSGVGPELANRVALALREARVILKQQTSEQQQTT